MRSCFVPWCDTICKKDQKRMMFLVPKSNEGFEAWRKVLPKKRELKRTDKICERHFRKEDIITTFDHVINGQLFQMERGRPKLKPNAIPCCNLPSEDEEKLYFKNKKLQRIRRVRMSKILKLEVQQLEDKDVEQEQEPEEEQEEEQEQQQQEDQTKTIQVQVIQDEEDLLHGDKEKFMSEDGNIIIIHPTAAAAADNEDDDGVIKINDKKELENKTSTSCDVEDPDFIENSLQVDTQALFDILFDDIFEVTLPSTLWGVHRDPERAFIAFSYFDSVTMKTTKLIILNCKGILNVFIFDKLVNEQQLTIEITHELLSNIIAQVDEAKICKKARENDYCKVKTVDDFEYCSNCP